MSTLQQKIRKLIEQQSLPQSYCQGVLSYLLPLAKEIAHRQAAGKLSVAAIQGIQGAGKSTAAKFLQLLLKEEFTLSAIILSLDDFYLSRAERRLKSRREHPLFISRGVPGTHDVALALHTIEQLKEFRHLPVTIPRFDKAIDDRCRDAELVAKKPDVIIFEGWCLGAQAQAPEKLLVACNDFERIYDADGCFRQQVNHYLDTSYQQLFAQIDYLLMLKAPAFEQAHKWRILQEEKLAQAQLNKNAAQQQLMSAQQLQYFIAHFERISLWCQQELSERADAVIHLAADHRMLGVETFSRSL
jgi:D-glycerate 3-kinase